MPALFCDWAYLPEGWCENVRIELKASGRIRSVKSDTVPQSEDVELKGQLIVPAIGNLHSHAFQRAMAGHAEHRSTGSDSFWTWREAMYRFVGQLTPDDVEAIAAFAYMEMLETGYAAVGEFHYLHHQPDGRAYDDPARMAHCVVAAAQTAGLGITLLPVLYVRSSVDDRPLNGWQQRFGNDLDRFAALHNAIQMDADDSILGVAAHSLRAVPTQMLAPLANDFGGGPFHIHIAEQTAEIEEVGATYGARPVEWLLDNATVNSRWCLIHATHMTPDETEALARSGAVAGLCPITEGNLGDGIFDGHRFIKAGGRHGIGSDSHVRIGLTEEFRILEYSQRLRDRRRTVLRRDTGSVGAALFDAAAHGGAQALGRDTGAIRAGDWVDLVALDADAIVPFVPGPNHWLDHWIFVAGDSAVRDVWSAGRHMVTYGRHIARPAIETRFKATMAKLMGMSA